MKSLKISLLIVILFTMGSCKKWLDINKDPSNVEHPDAEVLLPAIQARMAWMSAEDYRVIAKYTQDWTDQRAATDNVIFEKHGRVINTTWLGQLWRMVYVDFGPSLELMISNAEENKKWTYAGIGYAMKAWGWQIATDSYGQMTLDGAWEEGRLSFKYEDQPIIYKQIEEWCYKSLAYLNKTDENSNTVTLAGVSGDQIYKGDRLKWKKFIYGLLAQHYSHLRNKTNFNPAYADSVVKYVDISFSSAADDASIFMKGETAANSNPFSPLGAFNTAVDYGRITTPIVKLLTGGVRGTAVVDATTSIDPRLKLMLTPIPGVAGIYRGAVPASGDVPTVKTIPHVLGSVAAPYPGKYIYGNTARYPLMSYAQLQFAKAEAILVKSGPILAAHTAYINGIKGHMDFVNTLGRNGAPAPAAMTTIEINNYLASSEVVQPLAFATLNISDIMGQKYIAQWGWAMAEQWYDLRKYHYDPNVFKTYHQLYPGTNGVQYAYRCLPRYSSEYVWNRSEMERWGMLTSFYHYTELWSNKP